MITVIMQDKELIKCDTIEVFRDKYFLLRTGKRNAIIVSKVNCRNIIDI